MKKGVLVFVIAVLAVVLGGCRRSAPVTNRDDVIVTSTTAKKTFNAAAIEADVLKLEREWADATKTKNGDAVRRVVADDAVIVYPDGTVGTKADEVRTVESGAVTADAFEMLDPKVTVIDADAAYIAGRSVIRNGKYKDSNTNKTIDISGEYRFLDVYANRDGKWQVIASQATKIVTPAK